MSENTMNNVVEEIVETLVVYNGMIMTYDEYRDLIEAERS